MVARKNGSRDNIIVFLIYSHLSLVKIEGSLAYQALLHNPN